MGFGKYVISILFILIMFGSAYAAPGIPHKFYGFVTVNGAAAENAIIVAKINGEEFGRGVSTNGNYGISPNVFFVTDPDNSNSGKTIEFFLNGNKVAEDTFKKGAITKLDLSYGVAPSCGDGSCSGGETCETCPVDCGSCGGGTSISGSSPSGGSSNQLTMKIDEACINQPIEVTILNTFGNPAANATVKVLLDRKTIAEEKTGDDGIVSFTFEETGEYTFYATKNLYSQNSKTITLSECEEETGKTGEEIETSLCENVDCEDRNPCTTEFCVNSTGHCLFETLPDNTVCSAEGKCQKGVCLEPQPEASLPAGPTGLVGLSIGQGAGAGLVIAALIGLLAFLYARSKRKKKK